MGLPAGRTNNPFGRRPGSQNKNSTSKQIREFISGILSENIDRMQQDIDLLEPKDRLFFLEKLLQYSLPKLQATSIHTIEPDEENKKPTPEWLHMAV